LRVKMPDFILIVDDNKNLRDDLKKAIECDDSSRKIITAHNEYDASNLIKRYNFKIIITDIKLDEAGGTEIGGLKVLKVALKKNRKTKVIVVTAYGKKEVPPEDKQMSECVPIEEEVIKRGAFQCIQRPNRHRNYLEEVRHYVNLAMKAYNI